jgi:outer membrane protein
MTELSKHAFFPLRLPSLLRVFASGLILTAAGCVFDHDTDLYREILDGPHPAKVSAYHPDDELSLRRALQIANADNEAIGITGENYIQSLADKMKAAGNFLPTIGVAPTYNLTKGGSSGFVIGGGTTTGGTTGTTGGATGVTGGGTSTVQIAGGQSSINHDFTVPLDATITGSLANISTLQAAGSTVDQRALLILDERETILLQVIQSYYTALKAEHEIDVYQNSVNLKTEKVRDQDARLKLGAVKPLDVATSRSDLAAEKVSLRQARADAANARSALARLMGVTEVRGKLVDRFDPPAELFNVQTWQVEAGNRRQDLLAAATAVETARLKVDGAIREYFPSVTIDFNYFMYNDPTSTQKWSGGLSGNIPIFSALSIEGDVRTAWSQYRAALLTRSQVRHQVTDDVNEDFQNVINSRDKVAELIIEVQAAQQAYDLAERAYQLGSESNLDRLTQQDALVTAQLNLVSEQFNQKSNYLALLRASGQLATAMK